MLLLWSAPALAFRIPPDICDANLVFVGTVIDRTSFYDSEFGVDPRHPRGRIATRFTFAVERTVVDVTGDAADGVVEIRLSGGQIGKIVETVPSERPDLDIGDRYAFALAWLPEHTFPLVGDWSFDPIEGELPSETEIGREYEEYCSSSSEPRLSVDEKGCASLLFRPEKSVFASWWQNDVRRHSDLRLPDCDVSKIR